MQLTRASAARLMFALVAVGGSRPGEARADGTLTLRGAYYKERATRVVQPMLDGVFEVGEHGSVDGHLLVDAITSASTSSGAADGGFTERRYEGGAGYRHELPWGNLHGDFRGSREPDYLSLFGGAGIELELAEKNTIVASSCRSGTISRTCAAISRIPIGWS
jgi:hypothetical protein